MSNIKIIKHHSILDSELNDVCLLKEISWPYGLESQLNWINSNLSPEDSHALLMDGLVPVAYMNLINIVFNIDRTEFKGVGVGNVCTLKKNVGYGSELMNEVGNLFLEKGIKSLLFCKTELVSFYKLFEWDLVESSRLDFKFDDSKIVTMSFNMKENFSSLGYSGSLF